jgi:hypothetical protein
MIEKLDPIKQHLPKEGWLAEYINFTTGMEACSRFNFFGACCVLGAAINNKVWIQRGDKDLLPKIFPNIWVILLAPPGRGHKTTVINMACNALLAARDDTRILADKITPEYLVKMLAQPSSGKDMIRIGPVDATGLIKAPELSVFFGKQNYNIGLVSLITDLYDYRETWVVGTVGRGKEVLKNVCISVMGGSTPQWFQTMLPQDAFSGGFMSRFVLVEMPTNYFKRETFPKSPDSIKWIDLVKRLRELSSIEGEMVWGEGAVEAYEKIYESTLPIGEPQIDAYREREPEQVLKLAMLIVLSKGNLTLTWEELTQAKRIIEMLKLETIPRIERITTTPNMQVIQEIKDLLKINGEMEDVQILKGIYRSLTHGENQFKDALKLAIKVGEIQASYLDKGKERVLICKLKKE